MIFSKKTQNEEECLKFKLEKDSQVDYFKEDEEEWESDIITGCSIIGMILGLIFDNTFCFYGATFGIGLTYIIKGFKNIK